MESVFYSHRYICIQGLSSVIKWYVTLKTFTYTIKIGTSDIAEPATSTKQGEAICDRHLPLDAACWFRYLKKKNTFSNHFAQHTRSEVLLEAELSKVQKNHLDIRFIYPNIRSCHIECGNEETKLCIIGLHFSIDVNLLFSSLLLGTGPAN